MLVVTLLAAAMLSGPALPAHPLTDGWSHIPNACGGGPGPDPYPGSTSPVVCVDWSYSYTLPAINADTGQNLPGFYFTCHHRKDTSSRLDVCVLHHR